MMRTDLSWSVFPIEPHQQAERLLDLIMDGLRHIRSSQAGDTAEPSPIR
jgi:hypothetical protein